MFTCELTITVNHSVRRYFWFLGDEFFTTGSFISFPLVYHGALVGVVNLANRAMHGIFVDEDVERVRLLGLVISLVATQARLADRMLETLSVS